MQDLDWYIDLSGKKSGPFAVEDIIARYKNGEIPTSAYVTAQRMKGEWVRITDLVEAYRDLFQLNDGPALSSPHTSNIPPAPQTRTNIPRPTPQTPQTQRPASMPSVSELTSPKIEHSSSSSRFQAPPRPTEQLEGSKLISLNPPGAGSANPDATESLFQAIQAIREKNQMKTHPPATRDSWGELSRPKKALPAQSSLYLVLIGILLTAAYATYKIVQSRKAEADKQAAITQQKLTPTPAATSAPTTAPMAGKLLNDPSTRSAPSSGSRYAPPPRSKNITSPAGGNIRLTTPKRLDEEEEDEEVGHDEIDEENNIEPIEDGNVPNPSRNGNSNSDGSYSVDGGEGDEGGDGQPRPKPPILENAIDPNTGLPMNTQNE